MKKTATALVLALLVQITSACAASTYADNTGTIDLSAMTVTGDGISVSGSVVEITKGGDFTVTGENQNAMIHVDASDKVKLRLSGMSLKNESGPAIFYENAEKALLTITEGTENRVEDGSDYGSIDAKAAIFADCDLEIKGKGSLTAVGNYKHGIASDDDIDIENGEINITANVKDGIHVNNTFKMTGGTLTIAAESDGIQAEEDVIIDSGTIRVTKCYEGIESGTSLTINGGDIDINASDDGLNSGGGLGNGGQPNGDRPELPQGGGQPNGDRPELPQSGGQPSGDRPELPQNGGQPNGDRPELPQNGGQPSGDRPELPQNGSQPSGNRPELPQNGGQPSGDRPELPQDGENTQSADGADINIYINGGNIRICASGDGIDSNGKLYITGGNIIVDGPESNGDGAIDADEMIISGGTLLAAGSSGMAVGASDESEQCAFLVNLTESIEKDSVLTIADSSGNTVAEYTAVKAFNSIVYSDSTLKKGETYTLSVNDKELAAVEMTSEQVSVGERGGFGHGGGNGGFRGERENRTDNIRVKLQGRELRFDTSPIIENDTTLVPLRAIFEALGMTVEWNEDTQTVTAYGNGVTVSLKVGSTSAQKNGETVSLTAAPVMTAEDRTLVPVRFISESCGLSVNWNEETQTVEIN